MKIKALPKSKKRMEPKSTPKRSRAAPKFTKHTRIALERIANDKALLTHRFNLPADWKLHELVRELKYAAGYGTSPDNPNGAIEKDSIARRSLGAAGQLIGPLIKWAILHECGQIIAGVNPAIEWDEKFRSNANTAAKLAKRNSQANGHDNERRGAQYATALPHIERELVARVLQYLALGMGWSTGLNMVCALHDLEQGEVNPILQPKKSGRKGSSATSDRARLKVLQHIEFRQGLGIQEKQAVFDVAEAIGEKVSTLRKWPQRLRAFMDDGWMTKKLTMSRRKGQLVAAMDDNPNGRPKLPSDVLKPDFDNPDTLTTINKWAGEFSENELKKLKKLISK